MDDANRKVCRGVTMRATLSAAILAAPFIAAIVVILWLTSRNIADMRCDRKARRSR